MTNKISMGQIPDTFLPNPLEYVAPEWVAVGFSWWAGIFALMVLPWTLGKLIKEKDSVPLFMWFGGLICSLLEPMICHLGHIWWANNMPGIAFSGFGVNVPYLIPPCYVFFMAMTGYWAYTQFRTGLGGGGVFRVFFTIAMTDVILEIPGTASGAHRYYGDAPFKIFGFPLVWGFLNGLSMLMVGFLLWMVAPHLRGARRALILLVPVSAMGATYGMVAWPYFLAINWPMPMYAMYLWTLLSLALSVLLMRGVAAVAAARGAIP